MHSIYKFILDKKHIIKKIIPIELIRKVRSQMVDMKIKKYVKNPIDKEKFLQMQTGVNLVGDIKAEIGLGQSVRLIANVLDLSKYDFCSNDFQLGNNVRREDTSWDYKIQTEHTYNINLVHINPYEIGMAYMYFDKSMWENRYNIAFWVWELEEFPEEYKKALKFFDEIWTPSEFASASIRKATSKPVMTLPYHVTAECDKAFDRNYFGLPEEAFLYLTMFDSNSTMSRKNPIGAIEAFKQAFSKTDKSVGLVIKVNNPSRENVDYLRKLLEGYENVYYITKVMSKVEVNSLISDVDVFVSLHRAEGFGLVMAEAMLLKTACIATNWSSNIEFMNSEIACMLPYKMVEIEETDGCYKKGGIWAEPSIEEATKYMVSLKENPDYYKTMVEKAYKSVSSQLGKEKIVSMLENRLDEITKTIQEG